MLNIRNILLVALMVILPILALLALVWSNTLFHESTHIEDIAAHVDVQHHFHQIERHYFILQAHLDQQDSSNEELQALAGNMRTALRDLLAEMSRPLFLEMSRNREQLELLAQEFEQLLSGGNLRSVSDSLTEKYERLSPLLHQIDMDINHQVKIHISSSQQILAQTLEYVKSAGLFTFLLAMFLFVVLLRSAYLLAKNFKLLNKRTQFFYNSLSLFNDDVDAQIDQILTAGAELLGVTSMRICAVDEEGQSYCDLCAHRELCIEEKLMVGGEVYGRLAFIASKQKKAFSKDYAQLARQIASIIATALEKKEAKEKLEQAKEAAEASNVAKSDFLANMSHEIRTPLTAIIGFSETLLEPDIERADVRYASKTIIRSGKHLQNIINDILDLSKIEAGQLVVENLEVPLTQLILDVESIVSQKIEEKNLEFVKQYHFPLPHVIQTDPVRLKQILINLLNNAVKFTEQGSIVLVIKCVPERQRIYFEIKDTGIGMSVEEQSRLFKPFSQADSSTSRKYGGTGLGLVISRQLTEKLGGSLHMYSEKGKGSVFSFDIQTGSLQGVNLIYAIEDDTEALDVSRVSSEIRPLSGKILLADDSVENQQLISMYINKTGATVVLADNGAQALEYAQAQDFDLILMDMQMPVMDGVKATACIRERNADVPIIMLTANATIEDRQEALAAGVDDYLVKPLELERFYQVLNSYLEKVEKEKEPVVSENPFANDPQFQVLVKSFLEKLPGMMAEIQQGFDQSDLKQVEMTAHKLKGMGGGFGFPQITESAKALHEAARENQQDKLSACWANLKEVVDKIFAQQKSA